MVLEKRKPIRVEPLKTFRNDSEVWVLEATAEAFGSYEAYLKRLEYYGQRIFTCEITGHTNLSYLEALKSETHGSAEVDNTFPDQLREPILRRVQFSTISRIDELVNSLYETFKDEYFPGEHVTVEHVDDNGDTIEKLDGVVRNKTMVQATPYRPAIFRYFVTILGEPPREALVDNEHISRDRRSFTKQVLRSFLKNTISRERWDGAPWLVKERVARQYNIDTSVPTNLQYDNIVAERKAHAALKKGRPDEQCLQFYSGIPGLQQAAKAHKGKLPQELVIKFEQYVRSGNDPHLQAQLAQQLHQYAAAHAHPRAGHLSAVPPPQQVKYPIDDLEIYPSKNGSHRPDLKFMSGTKSTLSPAACLAATDKIDESSVALLLEIWTTINVHAQFFLIDSFTFDDFVDAILIDEDVECELLAEIHCAILKILVDDKGNIDPAVPAPPETGSEGDDRSADNSALSTPAPEAVPQAPKGKLRNSLLRNDISAAFQEAEDEVEIGNGATAHCAEEMLGQYEWADRLQARDFTAGGWQTIVIGLLNLMSITSRQKDVCEKILSHLAPVDQKPTQETARQQYCSLDPNLRVAALDIIIMLAIATRRTKDSMETRMVEMTEDRKTKVHWQREKKLIVEELHALDSERVLMMPDVPMEDAEPVTNGNANGIADLKDEEEVESDADTEDEAPSRAARRVSGRANELKRKREEEETRKKKQKQAKVEETGLQKIMKDIEKKRKDIKTCEERVLEMEEKLRMNACHRTKVLGRDRFWNRYYWFERNGMPIEGGAPSSTTAQGGYANGRLWVQGPDVLERAGFIDLVGDDMAQYMRAFGMSVLQRKELEEGSTQLHTAREFGFYESSESLDALMSWLDERGNRERALKKEISLWREKIEATMKNRGECLRVIAEEKAKSEEPVVGIATRKKTYVDFSAVRHPSLNWRNGLARSVLGQAHSEGTVVPGKRKGVARGLVKEKEKAVPVVFERTATRSGTRYR